MDKKTVPFAELLTEAVNEPGIISDCYRKFHGYSIGNQIWAWSQCKARQIKLGPIATFKRWQELGRQVKRGEKAISLVLPVTVKERDQNGVETGKVFSIFTVKNNWFVLDQTEGEGNVEEAAIPDWDRAKALEALNIEEIEFDLTDGNCQGYARERSIAINPIAQYPHKTRFHEIAHVVLGHTKEGHFSDDERTPRDIREVEAESVAYILTSLLSLPGSVESRGYIQAWLSGGLVSDKSAQKIFAAANKILEAGKV